MIRYSRQTLLPQIGALGQERLRTSRVLLVGCGALGATIADQLVRGGVGFIRIADRDIVELSNLGRQTLFDESDARAAAPKAVAAANRLARINCDVTVEPHVLDIAADNIESLSKDVDLILDGTDNVATRYLINDVAVKLDRPWVYGACVGVEGRVMPVLPGRGPCLRCVFEQPPAAGELPTCDTVGVLGSAAALVASWQCAIAFRILLNDSPPMGLMTFDVWAQRAHRIDISNSRRADCVCCSRRTFEYLDRAPESGASLCGRDAVQIRGARAEPIDLAALTKRLSKVARVERSEYLVRAVLADSPMRLTIFLDGRVIVHGTSNPTEARSLYDRFVGG